MSDQKISQLPAAATLTGTELVELVQSGNNVQSTPSAIGALAPPATPQNLLINAGSWTYSAAGSRTATTIYGFGTVLVPGVSVSGNSLVNRIAPVPAGTTLGTSVGYLQCVSTAVTGASSQVVPSNQDIQGFRRCSGRSDTAGFTLDTKFIPLTGRTNQTFFVGWTNNAGSPVGNISVTQVPSALLNSIGFSKDQADTNLQFLTVGSAAATKTDTGVTLTSLIGHLLRVTISCTPDGATVTATIKDLDGALNQTYTVLDGAANLVAADVSVSPYIYAGTGTVTSTAVQIGFCSSYINTGIGNN